MKFIKCAEFPLNIFFYLQIDLDVERWLRAGIFHVFRLTILKLWQSLGWSSFVLCMHLIQYDLFMIFVDTYRIQFASDENLDLCSRSFFRFSKNTLETH